jgi:hypothetical protein
MVHDSTSKLKVSYLKYSKYDAFILNLLILQPSWCPNSAQTIQTIYIARMCGRCSVQSMLMIHALHSVDLSKICHPQFIQRVTSNAAL